MDKIFADNFNEANREFLIEEDEKHDCNHCEYYSPMDGVCRKRNEQKHGYDFACDDYVGVTL